MPLFSYRPSVVGLYQAKTELIIIFIRQPVNGLHFQELTIGRKIFIMRFFFLLKMFEKKNLIPTYLIWTLNPKQLASPFKSHIG